jgi:precorrin-6Y C5,15-methyltransferase (decarboxylating)
MGSQITVVGIGADGWDGLSPRLRRLVEGADVLVGGSRHLGMVPDEVRAVRERWPSPLRPGTGPLLERYDGQAVVVLASGDPHLSGVGTTLVDLLGADRVHVEPGTSSAALARARMGWSAESTDLLSLVGRDPDHVHRYLTPGRRLVVLSADETTPAEVAARLTRTGFGASTVTVLGDLGSDAESRVQRSAGDYGTPEVSRLNVVCVEVRPDGPGTVVRAAVPGLPDEAFEHDGQITKRDLRAAAMARLGPCPGELLWDVGAGAGSVGIEWMRTDPRCRAVAVEARPARAARIGTNAGRLGAPALEVRVGRAPEALDGLSRPDAVFVGGGASVPGVLETCWSALRTGGRLVVHAVTLETEAVVRDWWSRLGGELTRLSVERVEPIGSYTGWAPARAVVQWAVTRTSAEPEEDHR